MQPERRTAYQTLKAVNAFFDDRGHFEAIRYRLAAYIICP